MLHDDGHLESFKLPSNPQVPAEVILAGLSHRSLGVYRAYGGEVETAGIIASAEARGHEVALPAMVDPEVMRFRRHRVALERGVGEIHERAGGHVERVAVDRERCPP